MYDNYRKANEAADNCNSSLFIEYSPDVHNSEVNVSMDPPQIYHKTCRIQVSHSSTPCVTRGWQHTPNHQSRRPAVNGSPSKHCVLCFNTTLLPRCDQAWELHWPLRPTSKSELTQCIQRQNSQSEDFTLSLFVDELW